MTTLGYGRGARSAHPKHTGARFFIPTRDNEFLDLLINGKARVFMKTALGPYHPNSQRRYRDIEIPENLLEDDGYPLSKELL